MSWLIRNGKPLPIKWSIGLVTSPRNGVSYLDQTLRSFDTTGWDNPVVFAEPGSPIPGFFSGQVVERRKQFGDWSNWAVGLYELLLTEPDTDYFLMLEDDVVFAKNVREYVEGYLGQLLPFASLSLFCPDCYTREGIPSFVNQCHGWNTRQTQTVIMHRSAVIDFFSSPTVQRHRFQHVFSDPPESIPWGVDVDPRNSVKDALIGTWAEQKKLPIYYHSPSLAQHIGIKSTLMASPAVRATKSFIGEDTSPNWTKALKITGHQSLLL